jgi:hypothetical protein
VCWCGQQWDGEKMCFPKPVVSVDVNTHAFHAEPAQELVSASAPGVHNA